MNAKAIHRFGSFELQVRERRLLAGGTPVSLAPRGFDLLLALVEQAGQLLTKQQLFSQVWPRVVVDDSALQVQISALRKIVGADAIATVSGQGYRFTMAVVHSDEAPAQGDGGPRHNLPPTRSSFVGREADLAKVSQLLARSRLVTLTGAGGCGKTRLALQVAAEVLDRHPDGVWFVALASLADPGLLPQALMVALGVKEIPGEDRRQTLIAHLASRRLLLVLDNAEHLLAACGEWADALLRECTGLALLVTSRERLGLVGELTCRVPSLSLPDRQQPATVEALAASEAARLFVERAGPDFAVTPQNAGAVAQVCWQLDGIPLAIELAAGRLRDMSVTALSSRLDQRFSLLRNNSAQPALPRHRTLRALIDWSHDLLAPAEQRLLARLSVFAGGCTLRAAEHICGTGAGLPGGLASLADKHLVVAEGVPGAVRYRLLETVRQYAAERLLESGEAADRQNRHLFHFAALADEAAPHLGGADQRLWFDRLERENDNLRAALGWSTAAAGAAPAGLRMATALGRFWQVRGHLTEGRAWLMSLLAAVPVDGHAALRAAALNTLGPLAAQQGDNPAARRHFEEAKGLFEALGDRRKIASTLNNLGICALHDGDYAQAQSLYEQNIAILRTLPHDGGLARSLYNLGDLMQTLGDHARSRTLVEEALALERAHGDRFGIAMSLTSLALTATHQGHHGEARQLLLEALAIQHELSAARALAYTLEALAFVEHSTAATLRAVRLWGAAQALRDSVGATLPANEQPEHLQRIATARATLADDQAFDEAWRQGTAMDMAQAVQHASRLAADAAEPSP